jgi:spore maturation protein SpmA
MLNWIFLFLIAGSTLMAAFSGRMAEVTQASMTSAKSAVELAIGLVGQMALWLGFLGILREGGLMRSLARGLRPVMTRLFPEVPPDHPAMGAMIMNLSANILGLGNAATPFGLKAMQELDTLNPHKGVATNSMALFLAINTSGVAVLALGVVGIRATLNSDDPAGILLPSLLATAVSTGVAITVARTLEGRRAFSYAPTPSSVPPVSRPTDIPGLAQAEEAAAEKARAPLGLRLLTTTLGLLFALALGKELSSGAFDWATVRRILSDWLLPGLMLLIVLFGVGRQVKVYEVFVQAAKEGFQIAVSIIPFLVAILVAIGMFRASGAMDALVAVVGPFTSPLGLPAEALPMALIRPLSGSGALAVMTEAMKTHGSDSFIGYLVSVLNGSTETTFYVLAVYFGSIQVRVLRHTLWACLAADLAGISAAVAVCHLFFG